MDLKQQYQDQKKDKHQSTPFLDIIITTKIKIPQLESHYIQGS